MNMRRKYVLYIDACAMERIFLTGQCLQDSGLKFTEYGLIGLAERSELPFHVISTPLLTGQQVNACSVHQAGFQVLSMRREIENMSVRLNKDLIPVAFIHKHPGFLGMSFTDYNFLVTTFADQVSSCIALPYKGRFLQSRFKCQCEEKEKNIFGIILGRNAESLNKIYYSMSYSIIVNRDRFAIYAARKIWCARCGHSTVNIVPAKLIVKPRRKLTASEKESIRRELEPEIRAKIKLKPELIQI